MLKYNGLCDYDQTVCAGGCSGTKITASGHTTTLVAYFGEDGNHHTMTCHCDDCGADFVKHWVSAGRKVWYTKDNHVVMGVAGCCITNYFNPCACGGWLQHSRHNKSISYKNNKPTCAMFWKCFDCGVVIEDEHHKANDKLPEITDLPIRFTVNQKIGEFKITKAAIQLMKELGLKK